VKALRFKTIVSIAFMCHIASTMLKDVLHTQEILMETFNMLAQHD
jgi:hypothetical protein